MWEEENERHIAGDKMVSRRKDYASAKQYIIDLTNIYAAKIIPPSITTRVCVKNISAEENNVFSYPTMAYAAGNNDGTKAIIVYNSALIKDNMYNMNSKFFNALIVHETCHVKHSFEEPGVKPRFYHSRPRYLDCMEKYFDRGMAHAHMHPDTYSFRAYLGSDNKIVPHSINRMFFYMCKDCRNSALWNAYNIPHPPFHCESCHSKNISWTKLNPFDVYRIAKINEIDFVEYTAPALYN
jgi:predicted SprT family Zn-dependent metalloprotease